MHLVSSHTVLAVEDHANLHPIAENFVYKLSHTLRAGNVLMTHQISSNLQAGEIWRPYAEAALRKSDQELANMAAVNLSLDLGTSVT